MICCGTIVWKRIPRCFCSATPLAYLAMNQSMRLAPPYPPDIGDQFTAPPLDPTRTRLPPVTTTILSLRFIVLLQCPGEAMTIDARKRGQSTLHTGAQAP